MPRKIQQKKPRKLGPKRRAVLLERRMKSRVQAMVTRNARRDLVADMLMEGSTYRQIAVQASCGIGTVFRDVKALMAEWRTDRVSKVEDVLTVQNRLLDQALRPLMKKVAAGNFGAIDMMLKIIDRRMKLYGLDALAVFEHVKEMLGDDDETKARASDRSIAQGLREIESIVKRYGGNGIQNPSDRDDPDVGHLN